MRDLPEDEKEKIMTLKRDKTIAKDQKKLEEMKKKLHTDDESGSFILIFVNSVHIMIHFHFFLASFNLKEKNGFKCRREWQIHSCCLCFL